MKVQNKFEKYLKINFKHKLLCFWKKRRLHIITNTSQVPFSTKLWKTEKNTLISYANSIPLLFLSLIDSTFCKHCSWIGSRRTLIVICNLETFRSDCGKLVLKYMRQISPFQIISNDFDNNKSVKKYFNTVHLHLYTCIHFGINVHPI